MIALLLFAAPACNTPNAYGNDVAALPTNGDGGRAARVELCEFDALRNGENLNIHSGRCGAIAKGARVVPWHAAGQGLRQNAGESGSSGHQRSWRQM